MCARRLFLGQPHVLQQQEQRVAGRAQRCPLWAQGQQTPEQHGELLTCGYGCYTCLFKEVMRPSHLLQWCF